VGGWFLLLCVIIFLFNRYGNQPESKRIQGRILTPYFIWLTTIGLSTFLYIVEPSLSYIFVCFAIVWLFAGLSSQLCGKFKLVKASYYLGKNAHFLFRQNPIAGGLLRGFQAAMHMPDDENRVAALRWIREQCMKRKKPLFSGEIIMLVIVDSLLSRPRDYRYLSNRLTFINDLPQASIPESISLLASKYALAPALANRNWDELQRIAKQWNKIDNNHIARYLQSAQKVNYTPGSKYRNSRLFWNGLRMYRYPALKTWVARYLVKTTASSDVLTESLQVNRARLYENYAAGNNGDINSVEKTLNALSSEDQRIRWWNRAKELGVWQPEEAWDAVTNSINLYRPNKNITEEALDNSSYEFIEQQHQTIRYICQSIDKKVNSTSVGSGAEHSLDWLNYMESLNNLGAYKSAQLSAFSTTHTSIWNWVASLWNDKKEYSLAFIIASHSLPYATECGLSEFEKSLTFINKH